MNSKLQQIVMVLFVLTVSPFAFSAGMQTQLDNIFTEMENYTEPGSYETQRRSAYFGGRYTYKTKIFDENLISMQLPSARGGCGGIDIFGGSFSFINSDQVVQLLRSVAANAKGYAFQLAMDNMCPNCMEWMNELQTKIQKLNEHLGNSCQLAQGLVNEAANGLALKEREKNEFTITGTLQGIGEDVFDLKEGVNSPDAPVTQVNDANPDLVKAKQGAVVYKALKQHSAENWFTGGDEELLETIMSMTGTTVVGPLVTGSDGDGETTEIWTLPGGKLTILDLMQGADNKEIYDCSLDTDTDHCMVRADQTQDIDIESLREKILTVLTGADGIITKIRNKDILNEPTETQKKVLSSLPHSIGSKIFELAPISPDAAEQMVYDSIDAITLEYINRLIRESFKAVYIAMANHENNYNVTTVAQIDNAKETLQNEYLALASRFGSLSDIEKHYNEIIKNARRVRYLSLDSQSRKPE